MPLLKTDTDTQTTAMSGDLSHNQGQTMNRILVRSPCYCLLHPFPRYSQEQLVSEDVTMGHCQILVIIILLVANNCLLGYCKTANISMHQTLVKSRGRLEEKVE